MNKRFLVQQLYVCPIIVMESGILKPNLEYPTRYCVIDRKKEIAIDISTNLKYDYIEDVNNLRFKSKVYKNLKENKRVAIFPFMTFWRQDYNIDEANKIIVSLKAGKKFEDGNELLNNHEYLIYVSQEQQIKQNREKNRIKQLKK